MSEGSDEVWDIWERRKEGIVWECGLPLGPLEVPRAAVTMYHKLGGFNVFSQSSGPQKSEIKMSLGPRSCPRLWANMPFHLFPALVAAGHAWRSLAGGCVTAVLPLAFSLCEPVSPLLKDASHVGLGAHLIQCDLILTDTSAKTLSPNKVTV